MTHDSRLSKTVSLPADIPAKLEVLVAVLGNIRWETVDGVEHGSDALVFQLRPDESETADGQTL